ncbi:MAG: HD-GYP domain-containing protein, partial [Acidobacteria bacterium]|nr:HD-GYP domain-containing protein [Acidobacteriota bacterium]
MDVTRRSRLAQDLVHRFAAALSGVQLYSADHPLVVRHITALAEILERLHAEQPAITVGMVGPQMIIDDTALQASTTGVAELQKRFRDRGIERLVIERGVEAYEIRQLLAALSKGRVTDRIGSLDALAQEAATWLGLPHIRVGRLQGAATWSDAATVSGADAARQVYAEGVAAATEIWQSAVADKTPDARLSRTMIDTVARGVAQNRTALLALVALKHYENYTFTHMVNVAILTMAQARTLGIEGPLLREFGLAALMHDIGKIEVPYEILTKTDKLTDEEFRILKRHPIDGAAMLRRAKEMPALAPIVAFEHHLRLDGSGYPYGVRRGALNLGTMLCSIADVYDAMRSQRAYQEAFPTDRILAVFQRNDGVQFDQHLVRRFVQLLGIYPPGNLVKLTTGEIAVVLEPYAADPYRPRVRLLYGSSGEALDDQREVRLWEVPPDEETGEAGVSVVSP